MTLATSAALEADGLTKRYGSHAGLSDATLRVAPGTMTAVLGPNGAGKTTLINLWLGLLHPTAGRATVLGDSPLKAVQNGRVGAMLQETALPSLVTVEELVSHVGSFYPRRLPVGQCLQEAGVEEIRRWRVERLSGGQRRRVAFALALVGQPEVVFLDEPTEGMDIEARQAFWLELGRFARQHGTTVLFSTHDLVEADRYADRVVLLARGRVAADGTPAALKARAGRARVEFRAPADRRAESLAQFLGVEVTESGTPGHFEAWSPDTDAVIRRLAQDPALVDFRVVTGNLDDVFRSVTHAGGEALSTAVDEGAGEGGAR